MQCVLTGDLAKTYDAVTLTRETSMLIVGENVGRWPPRRARRPDDRELHADYFEVIGKAPGGDESITNKVQAKGRPAGRCWTCGNLVLRGETASSVMWGPADAVEHAFNVKYHELGYVKVSPPPALVQTPSRGRQHPVSTSTTTTKKAYLTQVRRNSTSKPRFPSPATSTASKSPSAPRNP